MCLNKLSKSVILFNIYESTKPILFHAFLRPLTYKKEGFECYVLNLNNSFNKTIFLPPLQVLRYQIHRMFSKRIFRRYLSLTHTYEGMGRTKQQKN